MYTQAGKRFNIIICSQIVTTSIKVGSTTCSGGVRLSTLPAFYPSPLHISHIHLFCLVPCTPGFHSPINLHVFFPLFAIMFLRKIVYVMCVLLMRQTVLFFPCYFSRRCSLLNIILVTVLRVLHICLNKVCACSEISALLHLTSLPVRKHLTESYTYHGVSRSRYPSQRSRGACPGTRGNVTSSRCHDGLRCPDHGPLGETGSLSSASTSATGVTSTRPVRIQLQWDASITSQGV